MERERTVAQLQKREETMEKLTSENQSLSSETTTLKENLTKIEDKTSQLQRELELINERLVRHKCPTARKSGCMYNQFK